jgi:hypothetical protein
MSVTFSIDAVVMCVAIAVMVGGGIAIKYWKDK